MSDPAECTGIDAYEREAAKQLLPPIRGKLAAALGLVEDLDHIRDEARQIRLSLHPARHAELDDIALRACWARTAALGLACQAQEHVARLEMLAVE